MLDTIRDFLSKEAVTLITKKYPNLPADVQAKITDAIGSTLTLAADVAAIVVAIRNAPKA